MSYLREPSDQGAKSTTELVSAFLELKKKKNAVLLAHYYQEPNIQDIADYIGDSLGLAQTAAKTSADIIVFAGVVFMAETAKILNPTRQVLVPDMMAGCSLSDNCPPEKFAEFLKDYPGHSVVTYVNCSAEVKAMSDILCTSANAVKVINSIPKETPIVFAPDRHLGAYLIKQTGREMVLWDGACIVHDTFDEREIVRLKARHPQALIIAHPECPENVLLHADFIGSTTGLLNFVKSASASEFIVVTESGIIHQMQKACPEKTFYAPPGQNGCACSECPFMRLNTIEKLYRCLAEGRPEMILDPEIIRRALIPLERMLALS